MSIDEIRIAALKAGFHYEVISIEMGDQVLFYSGEIENLDKLVEFTKIIKYDIT